MKKNISPFFESAVFGFLILLIISVNADAGINEDLLQAIGNNDAVKVKACLANGADVNIASDFGDTALMAAAGYGKTDVVKILLGEGANVHTDSFSGNTALKNAIAGRYTAIAQILKQAGAK
jgi:ankyrin repeat protein